MPDDITKLAVAVAQLNTQVEGLTIADDRMRENIKGVYRKLDRLTYVMVAALAALVVDIVSHNLN